jgi:predicted AAA+ superfamily ATPase
MRGARQVGKTWMVRELARLSGKDLIELNFEKRPNWRNFFVSNDPKDILLNLESEFNRSILPEKTLLFLDEIQAMPELLSKLRWFFEDMPQLAVIAAGSLLEFTLADYEFSMPVGRINYLHVEPLSFEEFLMAQGQAKLYEFLVSWQWNTTIVSPIHEKLMGYVKEYMLIGGMPEAVASWQSDHSLELVEQIHHNLLATYRDDFAKYSKKIPTERLEEILSTTPKLLGEKFVFSRANKAIPTEILKKALQLLCMACVCHKTYASSGNGIPLGAEIKENYFKVILLDVGLAASLLDIKLHQLKQLDAVSLVNQGGISEQIVGQLLRTIEPEYKEPKLYYWLREQKNSNAEVDYLIQHNSNVIPIEVKSGSTGLY